MPKENQNKKADEVTFSQTFAAIVKRDGLTPRLVITAKRFFYHQLTKFKDGERVSLVLTNRKPKRTMAQNAYYWGAYLPMISEETGEQDMEALHELFKGKFLTKGIVTVLGERVRIKGSTANLGVGEFCDYILAIQQLTGVQAPPTENYDLDPLTQG